MKWILNRQPTADDADLQGITVPAAIMRKIAREILEHHHQASAREIASLLLDAAGVEVGR